MSNEELLSELQDEYSRLQQDCPQSHVMPWGKHKGELLQDLPLKYLQWLWTTKPSYRKLLASYLSPSKRPQVR